MPHGVSRQHRCVAARHGIGFAIGLARRQIDIEEMDLGVARRDRAVRDDQERAVGGLGVADLDRQRADQKPDAQFFGQRREGGQRRIVRFVVGLCASLAPPSGAIRVVFSGVAMNWAPSVPPRGSMRRVADIVRHVIAGTKLNAGGAEFAQWIRS